MDQLECFAGMVQEEGMVRADMPSVPSVDGKGPMNQAEVEEWVQRRLDEAKSIAVQADVIRERLRQLPDNREQARVHMTRVKLAEVFGIPVKADMSPTKFRAAVAYGWGLRPQEVAMALGCLPADIYVMIDDDFRAVAQHWREQRMDEYFHTMMRAIDWLWDSTQDPDTVIKLLKEVRQLAGTGEDRRRWEKEFELREREVMAKERDSSTYERQAGLTPLPVGAVEAIDIEVLEAEYEEEDEDAHAND